MSLQNSADTAPWRRIPLEAGRGRFHHPDPRVPSLLDEAEPATATRLQRSKERWEGLAEASRLAQITVLQHGGHDRPIVTRGGKHLRSRMGSRKTGLQQVVEGRGHRDLTMFNEVCPAVLDYQAHPFKIEFQLGGDRKVYYPDHIRLLRTGVIELIEVKRTPADIADPEYREKLAGVAEIARRVDWNFRILYQADIDGPPNRKANVEAIYMRRFMLLSREEQMAISEFVMAEQPLPWGDLRSRICPGDARRGQATLYCNVALGRISIDLDAPITDASIVAPCNPVPTRRGFRI